MDRTTELRRLAKALHKDLSELSYLDALDAPALMNLRKVFQNALIDEFGHVFEKIAGSGKLVPAALSATLCKKVFGPAITANMSYYTPVETAIKLCAHFDADFMTEVAREQLPEKAERMLNELPVDLMRAVTRKMTEHGDFHLMGAFTDFMPEEKNKALMEEIDNPADNLRISSFAQRKDRMASLASSLSDEKLKTLIKAAYETADLTREVLLITSEMSAKDQTRMAQLTDAVDAGLRQRAQAVIEAAGLKDRLTHFLAA